MELARGEAQRARIRAQLDAAVDSSGAKDSSGKAQSAILGAVLLSMGMGVVPFGINIGWFFAVSTGLIVYLGELYGYTYTHKQAALLLKKFFQTCGYTWSAYAFGLKFMAEVLKGAGIITLGGATPIGMALDAVLSGGITYAVGFTTLKYLEENEDLAASDIRTEFRKRFAEGQAKAAVLARQWATDASGDARIRYQEATEQAKERVDALTVVARERADEIGGEMRKSYRDLSGRAQEVADSSQELVRERVANLLEQTRAQYEKARGELRELPPT